MSRVAAVGQNPSHQDPGRLSAALVIGAQISAAALIGFGLILFIAAQWPGLSQWTRFTLVASVLCASGLTAILSARWRVPMALLTLMSIGGLLALVGITYQTGADPWQLFALWAVLSLPLALAARHDAVWGAWTLVVSTALPLFVHATVGWTPRGGHSAIVLVHWLSMALIAALFSPWMRLERWIGGTRWSFRLAATVLIVLVTKDAVVSLFGNSVIFVVGLLAFGGLVAALAVMKPFDFSLVAVATLAADVLLIAALWRIGLPRFGGADVGGFLILGLLSACIVVASVKLLLGIGDEAIARFRSSVGPVLSSDLDSAPDADAHAHALTLARWPAILLSAVGAAFAALPFWAIYGILFGSVLQSGPIALVVGAATLAAGVALASGGQDYGFRQIFGLIALITGGGVMGVGLLDLLPPGLGFAIGAVIATGLTAVLTVRWIGSLLGFVAALCVCAALTIGWYPNAFRVALQPPVFTLMVATLMGLALLVVVGVPRLAATLPVTIADRGSAFGLGWIAAILLATIAAAGPTFLLGATVSTSAVSSLTVGDALLRLTHVRVLAFALAATAVGLTFAERPSLKTPTGFALAGLAVVLSYLSPPFAIAVIVGGAMVALGHRAMAVFSAFVALWCVGALYYWVGISFERKALLLIGLGVALGLITLLEPRAMPALSPLALPTRQAVGGIGLASSLLIAGSVVATGGTVMSSISTHEAIIQQGRRVYVALAPVDPRSLMQGDFMALRFTMPAIPQDLQALSRLQAVATIDSRNIASLKRIVQHPAHVADGEVAVDLTFKGNWMVATDAFFFREGQANTFETARFGEFRLKQDGAIVLVGLADKDLRPLGR